MGALAGLVDKGLVAPDWAAALAPVDDRIAAMGRFLREEIAAHRPYLPQGDHILRAFQRPLANVFNLGNQYVERRDRVGAGDVDERGPRSHQRHRDRCCHFH